MIKLEKEGQVFEVETELQASAFLASGYTVVVEVEKPKRKTATDKE